MTDEPTSPRPESSDPAREEHPFNRAARDGFGPLSPHARDIWHGDSTPCVSCANLVRRHQDACGHCGQDLSQEMLARMAKHSGPWYVYDPIRPFPGVTLERIARQIKRHVLTATSIVRGPTTYAQWRYAADTPLIARLLGRCWNCQVSINPAERYCPKCKVPLDGNYRADTASRPAAAPTSEALSELGKAVSESPVRKSALSLPSDRPLGRMVAVFIVIGIVLIGLLIHLATDRGATSGRADDAPAAPAEQSHGPVPLPETQCSWA